MATKKNVNVDGVYIVSQDATDNPKLMARKLNNGKESLFLLSYHGYKKVEYENGKIHRYQMRKKEHLGLYLWTAPRTATEREQNKETLELAKKIRFERAQELLQEKEGYRLKSRGKESFTDYFQTYIDNYTKKNYRAFNAVLKYFKAFLSSSKNHFSSQLTLKALNADIAKGFAEYLQTQTKGETPHSYFKCFKQVINHAIEHGMLNNDPCKGVVISYSKEFKKESLTAEEIITLSKTHYRGENPIIQRAFLFSCLTGLRFCDVKELTFANIDFSRGRIRFEQNKTKGHSANSIVDNFLHPSALALVGKPEDPNNREELIFKLPSSTMCNKALRVWCKHAKIDKHITWHCGRHTCGMLVSLQRASEVEIAKVLGHSGLRYVTTYVNATNERMKELINSLPKLNI